MWVSFTFTESKQWDDKNHLKNKDNRREEEYFQLRKAEQMKRFMYIYVFVFLCWEETYHVYIYI